MNVLCFIDSAVIKKIVFFKIIGGWAEPPHVLP
jgi:hypothetical protein